MRNTPGGESGTWASLVRSHRQLLGMTQKDLAVVAKVGRETIWRWETGKYRPEELETVLLVARALHIEKDAALRATGFAVDNAEPEPDPYAYVREMGLDPNNRVVRVILAMNVTEDFRMRMLRRERQLQLRDEQARLDDLEFLAEQQREQERQRREAV